MPITKITKPYTHVNSTTADANKANENDDKAYAAINTIIDNINDAEGTKNSLTKRLDVSMNQDGTLRSGITWVDPNLSPVYDAANQFHISGDHTGIFVVNRRVRIGISTGTVQSYITAASHNAGTTTVTINDSVLTDPVSTVEYETYSVTAGGEWIDPDLAPVYDSGEPGKRFTVVGDHRDIYLAHRRLRIDDSKYSEVASASYTTNITTVTIKDAVLSDPITKIEHGSVTPLSHPKRSISIDTIIPIGAIVAWMPGYFADTANGTFTHQLIATNDVAGANGYLNDPAAPLGWAVCDGAAPNDADSPIFNAAGRHLPNLTDDRFLMGDTVAGGLGGSNMMLDHQHSTASGGSLTAEGQTYSGSVTSGDDSPDHTHSEEGWGALTGYQGSGSGNVQTKNTGGANTRHQHSVSISHTHAASSVSGTIGGGVAPTSTENRPQYLSCFYIMRIK